MDKEIRKINIRILILIVILIPINQIAINYLFKIRFFIPLTELTDYWIQPTLIGNILSLILFSLLIFNLGKHNLYSVWMTKEKLKTAVLPLFLLWLISQIITIVVTYISTGKIVFVEKLSILTGSLIGQLFGNASFEELIYRGILFVQLFLLLKPKTTNNKALIISIIISQILFALIHIPNRLMINQVDNMAMDLLGLFVAGVVLTAIYIRTRNLAFVIGVHTLINQPFNLIDTTFPMEVSIYVLIIFTTILWNRIAPNNTSNFHFSIESKNKCSDKLKNSTQQKHSAFGYSTKNEKDGNK